MLKLGEVQLHVHCADHLLEGHSSHGSHEARAPQGPLVYSSCHGVEGHGLQLRDVGGDGYGLQVCLLDGRVRVFQEQGDPSPPAYRAAKRGAAHDGAQGHLVYLGQVTASEDVVAEVCL